MKTPSPIHDYHLREAILPSEREHVHLKRRPIFLHLFLLTDLITASIIYFTSSVGSICPMHFEDLVGGRGPRRRPTLGERRLLAKDALLRPYPLIGQLSYECLTPTFFGISLLIRGLIIF